MNRILSTMSVGLLSVCGSLAQDTPPDERLKELITRVGDYQIVMPSAVFSLSTEEKQFLLEHFRERARALDIAPPGRSDRAVAGRGITRARAVLGDPEIIEPWLRNIREADIRSQEFKSAVEGLRDAGQPETVVKIAPLIQVDEPYTARPWTDDPAPRSYSCISVMFRIVATSPAFDGKTRKWAEDNVQIPFAQSRALMQRWLKDNEEHLKAGDYKAIKPGEEIRAGIEEEARKKREEALAAQALKPILKPHGPAASTDSSSVKSPQGAATPAAATDYIGYAAVGMVVLLLASGPWFYRRASHH